MPQTETGAPFTEPVSSGSSWMQITFTIDLERYRLLLDKAEEAHLTVPSLVREIVEEALRKTTSETTLAVAE